MNKRFYSAVAMALIFIGGGGYYLYKKKIASLGEGLYKSNGRIEAVEIYISTKFSGRLEKVYVREGDFVKEGQVLAKINTDTLEAQLNQAKAHYKQALAQITTARSKLSQTESEKELAIAFVEQKRVELNAAKKRYARSSELAKEGASSQQEVDDDRARVKGLESGLVAAKVKVKASETAIETAKSQVISFEASAESAKATVDRLNVEIEDAKLKAPRDGRVQYIIARGGEIVAPGGRILNLLDLTDVYMNFFLPTSVIGKLAIGQEARIVLDAAPKRIVSSNISFISDEAQFTPKTVETKNEREKLMFRVKSRLSRELLKKYIEHVKTGLPGVVYVKVDNESEWPEKLNKNIVQ